MKPKFGTPEYYIDEARKELDKASQQLLKLRDERGVILEVKNISLPSFYRLEHYHKNSWNSFDPLNRDHVEKAYNSFLKLSEEKEKEIEETHILNQAAIENNEKAKGAIFDFLSSYGIRKEKSVWKGSVSRGKYVTVQYEWISELQAQIPCSDGYSAAISTLKESRKNREEEYKKLLAEISKKEKEKEAELEKSRLFVEAFDFCKTHSIDVTGFTNAEVIASAEEKRRELWIAANYPDGTKMRIKCCDNCNSWIIGHYRCSCGNRRMYLEVEGKNGEYWAYAQAD